MHLSRTAIFAAGALVSGMGSASASMLTSAPQTADVSSDQVYRADWDYCDDWNHRGDAHCRGDRWTWDAAHHRWVHDRWDGHHWNRR